MKHLLFTSVILMLIVTTTLAQKTTRSTIVEHKGIIINMMVTEGDTTYLMMGQNAKYTHIVNTIILKSGGVEEIYSLLEQCAKMMPEKDGTSLQYDGNTIATIDKQRVMLFGTGRDSQGFVLLNAPAVTKLMAPLKQL